MTTAPTIRPALDSLREDVAAARKSVADLCALGETLLPVDSPVRKWIGEARTYLLAAEQRLARDARTSAQAAAGKPPVKRAAKPKPAPTLPVGMKLVDRVMLPRYYGGCDYDVPLVLLARRGKALLFWWPSHKTWVSQGQSGTSPSTLCLIDPAKIVNWGTITGEDLHEGG